MSPTDLVTEEQPRVDDVYRAAEAEIAAIDERLSGEISAGSNEAAHKIWEQYEERREELREMVAAAQLLTIGRFLAADEHGELDLAVARCRVAEDGDAVAVHWGAPLAAAFYDPESFSGEVRLVRGYDGRDRRVTTVDQKLPRGEGRAASDAPGADGLLERLLESSDGRMRDVVSTIQAEQYRLMQLEPGTRVVVQGGPGTGKTVVGLHRVAMLLHRNRETLAEDDVLVVGPNDVFVRYIEDVLPDLGRKAVRLRSIASLGGLEVRERDDQGLTAQIKGDPRMADVIRRYLEQRIGAEPGPIEIGTVTISAHDADRLVASVRGGAVPYNTRRASLREALRRAVAATGGSAIDVGSDLDNALNRLMPDRAPRRVVADLLTGPNLLAAAADGQLSPTDRAAILRESSNLETMPWTRQDVALVDEAAFQLDGLAAMGDTYRHIVVDEAQNLSPMELRMFARRLAQGAGMTVLGDLAQGVSPWVPRSWRNHLRSGAIELDDVVELAYGYRIPGPVMDFANRLMDVIDVDVTPPTAVIEEGEPPRVVAAEDAELDDAVVAEVSRLVERDDGRTAVVASADEVDRLTEVLRREGHDAQRATSGITGPVTVVTFAEVGGLEFDHVVVVQPETEYRTNGLTGPRSLYVAMTRCRRTLTLVHTDDLPRVLVDAEPETPPTAVEKTALADADTAVPAGEDALTESRPESLPPPPPMPAEPPTRGVVPSGRPGAPGERLVHVVGDAVYLTAVWANHLTVEVAGAGGGRPVALAHGAWQAADSQVFWVLVSAAGAQLSGRLEGGVDELAEAVVAALVRGRSVDETDAPS